MPQSLRTSGTQYRPSSSIPDHRLVNGLSSSIPDPGGIQPLVAPGANPGCLVRLVSRPRRGRTIPAVGRSETPGVEPLQGSGEEGDPKPRATPGATDGAALPEPWPLRGRNDCAARHRRPLRAGLHRPGAVTTPRSTFPSRPRCTSWSDLMENPVRQEWCAPRAHWAAPHGVAACPNRYELLGLGIIVQARRPRGDPWRIGVGPPVGHRRPFYSMGLRAILLRRISAAVRPLVVASSELSPTR